MKPFAGVAWVGFLVALIASAGCGKPPLPDWAQAEKRLQAVMGQERFYRDLTPSPDGRTLWYVSCTANGRRLFSLDLSHLTETVHFPDREIGRVYGWNNRGEKLALTLLGERMRLPDYRQSAEWPQLEQMAVFNPADGTLSPFTNAEPVIDADAAWLDDHSLMFTRYYAARKLRAEVSAEVETGSLKPLAVPPVSPVVMSSNQAAYCDGLNLFAVTLNPPKTNRLTYFRKVEFDPPRWLRYEAETGGFLFCSRPGGSDNRYLFHVAANTNGAVQLNLTDTYNGQWLHGGAGYALVCNVSNLFSLEIHPADSPRVCLFTNGGVVSYTASKFDSRVYACAAVSNEPSALWEYDYGRGALRKLTNSKAGLAPAEVVEKRVIAADGLAIPYFVTLPAGISGKHPLIIFVPPPTGQSKKTWEAESQFLAHLGVYYVAVNARGSDGYGRSFSENNNSDNAMGDLLAVREAVLGLPNVDASQLYLAAQSGGTGLAARLLGEKPGLWRGAILREPGGVRFKGQEKGRFPRVLVCVGEYDQAAGQARKQLEELKQQGFEARLEILKDAGHNLQYYPRAWLAQERAIYHFLVEH